MNFDLCRLHQSRNTSPDLHSRTEHNGRSIKPTCAVSRISTSYSDVAEHEPYGAISAGCASSSSTATYLPNERYKLSTSVASSTNAADIHIGNLFNATGNGLFYYFYYEAIFGRVFDSRVLLLFLGHIGTDPSGGNVSVTRWCYLLQHPITSEPTIASTPASQDRHPYSSSAQ